MSKKLFYTNQIHKTFLKITLELLKNSIVKIRKIASIVHSIQYKQIKN
ncbi:Uncharacterized protein NV38_0003253 [Leptospira kirschneri serovar Mozdok]|nr:Uncharacterized protein NV38_0003253 [Leptospira kirschneri serovar Mozdok]